ncbi:MAG TPA: M12 family metallo-peptidase [Lysobacter sp.]
MKLRVPLLLALTLVTAACSKPSGPAGAALGLPGEPASNRQPAGMGAFPVAKASLAHRFAGLPDRGSLVRYPARPVVRRDGAYTWHRADLSEAHARAAIGGTLMLTSPSGEPLGFRYSRHAEHPNGDWTWVGSSVEDPGREAIVTFGDKAAFGSIGQPGKEPLRLTIANGTSWLVETDPRQIAGIVNAATRPTKPDFFVAPEVAAAVTRRKAASGASVEAAAASTAAATPASGTTVDVVIGYTDGFVAGLGGESQAQTRLNFLVDVTNEAYVNSQVNANVRLVKTVLVNYPDATSNGTALEELTGFKAPSTQTTPSAAFSALRAARDRYGADLVSLVRKFNDPENEGCGIAWLIGGGRSGIDQNDEYFGYSVVSDGRDTGNDGKTYFCRDETFAHELGHNMGSAHDRDTADGSDNVLQNNEYGVYDYSFGYKTNAANGNFYTVMAYGDSGQDRYRVFSNPRVTLCGNRACGTVNQADNARSLAQTVPQIAAFRPSTVPLSVPSAMRTSSADINADGRSDIYWHNPSVGFAYWLMNGSSASASGAFTVQSQYVVAGTGDYNGDGRADVLWRDQARTELWLWSTQANGAFDVRYLGRYPGGWEITSE